VYTYLMGSLNI